MDGANKPFMFTYPHQDIFISMTEALKENNLTAYTDLVEHLKNLSILAFDEKDFDNIEKVDRIKTEFRRHIDKYSREKLENSTLYNIETVSQEYNVNANLKILCEFRFSGIIERICISALRKTILREQVPEAQTGIFYKPARDIELAVKCFNMYLQERGLPAMEVKL